MRVLFVFVCIWALSLPAAGQRTYIGKPLNFYVSPKGSDARDCRTPKTACATMQATWNKIISKYDFSRHTPQIVLMNGVHASGLTIYDKPVGGHLLTVMGEKFDGVNCPNPGAVVVRPADGTAAFWAQDGATMVVNCLKVEGRGVIGFQARQHVIFDIDWIDFGDMVQGVAITDHSIANLGGDNIISGSMNAFVAANFLSTIRLTGTLTITRKVEIKYFVLSYTKSFVELAAGASIINGENVIGQRYRLWRRGDFSANGMTVPGNLEGANVDGTGQFYP